MRRFFSSNFRVLPILALVAVFWAAPACNTPQSGEINTEYGVAQDIALSWNKLMLELERHTDGYRPPVSARTFAYIAMAAYEAAVPGMEGYVSLEHQFPEFKAPAFPADRQSYHLPTALNRTYSGIMRRFFRSAPPALLQKIDHLETEMACLSDKNQSAAALNASNAFAEAIVEAVWRYSISDGMGHDGFLYNFDKNYANPDCAGCWQPSPEHHMPALLPHWGGVRTFMMKPSDFEVVAPPAFSESPQSPFYTEAMEVFTASQSMSKEDAWIAEFWSDDLPGLTVTPAGRWISIANQNVEHSKLPFPEVMAMYLKLSVALCDAGIICWDAKYEYSIERPETYIRRLINPNWRPLHETPNFPAYPSGHSAFGGAATEILAAYFGQKNNITDRTHQGRIEFAGHPRTFNSFQEMGQENAYSRLLIGVHYRMDCVEGMRLGRAVAQQVIRLPLRGGTVSER